MSASFRTITFLFEVIRGEYLSRTQRQRKGRPFCPFCTRHKYGSIEPCVWKPHTALTSPRHPLLFLSFLCHPYILTFLHSFIHFLENFYSFLIILYIIYKYRHARCTSRKCGARSGSPQLGLGFGLPSANVRFAACVT